MNLKQYGLLNQQNFILNHNLDFTNLPNGTYTYTFWGAGTANTGPLTLPNGETDAPGPYVNTSTVTIPVGSELKIAGTLNSYTQELQQLSLLKGAKTPSINTIVNGTLDAGRIDVVNGSLAGTGTILDGSVFVAGPVSATKDQEATSGGSLLPGSLSGIPGKLTIGSTTTPGDVTMYGATLGVFARGATTPGTDYSQLFSFGKVSLGNSKLNLSLVSGYNPKAGDVLTIISALGGITGTFSQGTSITVNGFQFTITYNQNSVVLTFARHGNAPPQRAAGSPNPPAGVVQPMASLAAAGLLDLEAGMVEAPVAEQPPPKRQITNSSPAQVPLTSTEEHALPAAAGSVDLFTVVMHKPGHELELAGLDLWTQPDLIADLSPAFIP
jgi:hypothetical protein